MADVESFFHEPTNSLTHLVSDPATRAAAVIDPVLDYDQRRGTMRAWLFGIAMRIAAKQRRRARPITTLATLDIEDPALGDPERYVARLGAAAIADRLISAIPAEQSTWPAAPRWILALRESPTRSGS